MRCKYNLRKTPVICVYCIKSPVYFWNIVRKDEKMRQNSRSVTSADTDNLICKLYSFWIFCILFLGNTGSCSKFQFLEQNRKERK